MSEAFTEEQYVSTIVGTLQMPASIQILLQDKKVCDADRKFCNEKNSHQKGGNVDA